MIVIFTDLDGTLLDYEGYQFAPAGGGLYQVRRQRVPLVFTSSKTLEEQRRYQHEMDVEGPMIVESGSAVVLPVGYFDEELVREVVEDDAADVDVRSVGDRIVLVLGRTVDEVRAALAEAGEETELAVRGFGDMSLAELEELTGLPETMARRARAREYSETIFLDADADAWKRLRQALRERGLAFHGEGPLATVLGAGTDKGRGVRLVTRLFGRASGQEPTTVGLGDGPSDVPMLEAVDRPFLVERQGGGWIDADVAGVERVEGVGPRGWERAIRGVLDEPVKQSRPRASIWGGEGEKDGT